MLDASLDVTTFVTEVARQRPSTERRGTPGASSRERPTEDVSVFVTSVASDPLENAPSFGANQLLLGLGAGEDSQRTLFTFELQYAPPVTVAKEVPSFDASAAAEDEDDKIDKIVETRRKLLERMHSSRGVQTEDATRMAMCTERLRELVPRITREHVAEFDARLDHLESLTSDLEAIEKEFDIR
jgi:hypothetical protein